MTVAFSAMTLQPGRKEWHLSPKTTTVQSSRSAGYRQLPLAKVE